MLRDGRKFGGLTKANSGSAFVSLIWTTFFLPLAQLSIRAPAEVEPAPRASALTEVGTGIVAGRAPATGPRLGGVEGRDLLVRPAHSVGMAIVETPISSDS